MKTVGFFWLLSITMIPCANAQLLVRDKGDFIISLEQQFVRAKEAYQLNDNVLSLPTLNQYTSKAYLAYGFSHRLSAFTSVPFLQAVTLNRTIGKGSGDTLFLGDRNIGFADPEIGLKYAFYKSPTTVLNATALVGLPWGESRQANDLRTGDGEFNQQVGVEATYSFPHSHHFISIRAAYNNRTKGFADECLYSAQWGYTIQNRWSLLLSVKGNQTLYNGQYYDASGELIGGSKGLYANNEAKHQLVPELNYHLNKTLALQGRCEFIFIGRNTLKAPLYSVGFIFHSRQ